MVQNKGIIYKSVPEGYPVEGKDLIIEDRPFDLDADPPENGVFIKNHYASFDPYQRGRMRDPKITSYIPAFETGQPIGNSTVSQIIKSKNPDFPEGAFIRALTPTEEYSILTVNDLKSPYTTKLSNSQNIDWKLFIGALGMPGETAYSSLYEICAPKKGQTIFISSAGGAVGQVVGQLAKREGLTVYGSVGSDEKLDFILKELAFDGGFNYKKEDPTDALKRLAPEGLDIYYDNVGGETLDAALASMKNFGKIVACGRISQSSKKPDEVYGIKNMALVVAKRLKIQGFIVSDPDFGPKYAAEHQRNLQKWLAEGSFKAKSSVTYGIDNGIKGFLGMLKGENFGKAVLEIAPVN